MSFQHKPECIAMFNRAAIEQKKWRDKHWMYCRTCNGWGGVYSTYDPSPAGVGLSSGYMEDFDPCPDCIESGKCPHCAKEVDPDAIKLECIHCGWSEEKNDGMPPTPECLCWVDDVIDW